MDTDERYEFGDNWSKYIDKEFNDERLNSAREHLLGFLKLRDLSGRSFIDIGCGSGLHSYAALLAGVREINSIDYDVLSVSATKKLYERAGRPANWQVRQGSVLDTNLIESLPKYDIVYSWGVLHHTGDMWAAMKNVTGLMKDDGVLYISLYTSDVFIKHSPEFWLKVKLVYNKSGSVVKKIMELLYAARFAPSGLLDYLGHKIIRTRGESRGRGMSFWTDIRDWLGGWPMEYAAIKDVKEFYINQCGLELLNINAGEATTEYLFRKNGARNYWDEYLTQFESISLQRPYAPVGGNAYKVSVPDHAGRADTKQSPKKSQLMLYEDGVPVGFAHVPETHIRSYGNGRYLHYADSLIFSATDNTDPNSNGRNYSYLIMDN